MTIFGGQKQSTSPDFRCEKQVLLVDLESAEKITLTIREEKIKIEFWKKKYFFQKSLKKSEFLSEKNVLDQQNKFQKSSRMVAVIFSDDSKSSSRMFFPHRKFRNIDCFRIPKIVQKEYLIAIKSLLYCQPVIITIKSKIKVSS